MLIVSYARPVRRMLATLLLAGVGACGFNPSEQTGDPRDGAVDGAELDGGADATAVDAGIDATDASDAADPDAAIDAAPVDAADLDGPGPVVGRTLIDDTAAELGAGPPAVNDGRIDASGWFAPRAYYRGGLCASGSNARLFDDGATAAWPVLAAARPSLIRDTGGLVPAGATPPGVGLTDADDWTLLVEGEVYLTAGSHTFGLSADDHGLLELAPAGSATFTRLLGVNVADGLVTAGFSAPANGWYGLRYAVAQRTGVAQVRVQVNGAELSRLVTRCRVDQRTGLAQTASDESQGLDVAGTTIDATPQVASVDWGSSRPADLGLGGADTFTVRWAGQVRVDVAGSYTLRLATDDGHRLWIDGVKVLDAFDDAPHDQTTGARVLAVGWHDLVIEVSENTGDARAALTVATGPDLVGMAFPPARLRPSEARSERFEARTLTTNVPIAGQVTFRIAALPGAVVTGVDVGYRITHPNLLGVSSRLTRGATTIDLRNAGSSRTTDRFHLTGFAGADPSGDWVLAFSDFGPQMGELDEAWLTVHYADPAGLGPIADSARLESSVRDLLAPAAGAGQVVSIDQVRFTSRDVVGDTVGVWLRTCDDPTACAAQPWSGPYASGASVGVVPRRYAQYLITMASDTDHEPALDRVELDYQTR